MKHQQADWVVTRSACLEEPREWEGPELDVMCEAEICESEPKVCKLCAKCEKQTDGMPVCSHHQNRNTKSISLTSVVENEHEPQAGKEDI